MHRFALDYLMEWKHGKRRKPLVIRGARQVGKSTLVRLFAKKNFKYFFELNFERDVHLASLFTSKDPKKTLARLELHFNASIEIGESLLFLDEIQAAPEILANLRYFYEELPELHVIAAGSLLEFALKQVQFSIPVGRIEYLYLGPLQLEEFLLAVGDSKLCEFLRSYQLTEEIPLAIHRQLLERVRQFAVVGGMPESVAHFVATRSYHESEAVKNSILATYQDDFAKYGTRVNADRLRKIFARLPYSVGKKLKYVHLDPNERAKDVALTVEHLCLAQVAYLVRHSSANGVPLAAETKDYPCKALFLDVGLLLTATGLRALDIEQAEDLTLAHAGVVAEQWVGQHLLYAGYFYERPQLYCWMREKKHAAAEVDYVINEGVEIIPVEVKAGKTGSLKSLHVFLNEKKRRFALRFNNDLPSFLETTTTLSDGQALSLSLLSLPFYLIGQARRLCREVLKR